jgi:hypothetical protein
LAASQELKRRDESAKKACGRLELAGDLSKQLKHEVRDINIAQNKFEVTIADTLNRKLKGVMALIRQQNQGLSEFSSQLQVTDET